MANLDTAIECFSILSPTVTFSRVDTNTFDVYVNTPSGEVPFEFLSSGFKASYCIVLGIIKEIEYRGFRLKASNFGGVILIDELDLHLHPIWQRVIPKVLKQVFAKAQIIATTHSPHMVQEADAKEVISLVANEHGRARVSKIETSKYGFKGWTIEEILLDVMGVKETATREYRQAVRLFDRAVDGEDQRNIILAYQELNEMLHPSNHLRKLLRIQAAPFIGDQLD